MKRFILKNKFLNFFTRKYSHSVVFPAWTLEKFKQYYRSQITRISSATSKNPEDIPSYLANDYFRLALEKDPTAEAKIFVQEIQKFTEDEKCKAVAVRGVNKLEKITQDQNCYFNALLASAIMSYVGKERVDSMIATDSTPLKEALPHIDIASPELIPQYMAIIVIDSNSSTKTYVAENNIVIVNLQDSHPEVLEILSKVNFKFNYKYFDKTKDEKVFKIISLQDDGNYLICLPDDNKKFCLDQSHKGEYDEEQIFQIVDKLKQIVKTMPKDEFVMANSSLSEQSSQDQNTQFLFFKNTETLHGRYEVPRHDKRDMVFIPYREKKSKPNINEIVAKEINSLRAVDNTLKSAPEI